MNLKPAIFPLRHLPAAAALVILTLSSFPSGSQAHPAPAGRSPFVAAVNAGAARRPAAVDAETRAALDQLEQELDEERETLSALQRSLSTEKRKVRALQQRLDTERRRLGILPPRVDPPAYVPPTF